MEDNKNIEKISSEAEAKEAYDFLFKKIMVDKAKSYGELAISFRECVYQNGYLSSPSDQIALDLLCFFAFSNDKEPWNGRECALEAMSILRKNSSRFTHQEALSCYELLLVAFSQLEDVNNERACADEAAFHSYKLGKKEDAELYMLRNIELCFRFAKEDREKMLPTYEALTMMFGADKAKEYMRVIEQPHFDIHDPIETNPLFIKVLPMINKKLKEYFVAHPNEWSRASYNEKKKEYLLFEGFSWMPPKKA